MGRSHFKLIVCGLKFSARKWQNMTLPLLSWWFSHFYEIFFSILFLIIFIGFILSNFPGVTFYIFSVFVSDIHPLPLPLSHANRPRSQFTMHSYKIINISTLTSQVGGKWLVHSGTFDQDTCHIEQQQQSLVVSVYLVLAATIFRLLVLPPCQWWMLTRPHYAAGGQSDQESELLLSCNTLVHMCCIGSP